MVFEELNNKIYIIGTAEYGPINTPILISSFNELISIFGNRGSLIENYKILRTVCSEKTEITVVKTTGSYAELYIDFYDEANGFINEGIYIRSKHATEKGNKIKVKFYDNTLSIGCINGKSSFEKKYLLDDNTTLNSLLEEINEDTRLLKNEIFCYCSCQPDTIAKKALACNSGSEFFLAGGESGLFYTKNMIYNALEKTYSVLKGYDIDIIIPLDINYNDTFTDDKESLDKYYDLSKEYLTLKDEDGNYLNFCTQLMDFLISQMQYSISTTSVLGFSTENDVIVDEGKFIEKIKFFKEVNKLNPEYDKYNHLISVCVGDMYYVYGTKISSSKLAYTGLISNLVGATNSTNKPIIGQSVLCHTFNTDSLKEIANNNFVVFRYSKVKRNIVAQNGVTMSSDVNYKYYSNVRAVQIVVKAIKKSLQDLIGCNIIDVIRLKKIDRILSSLMKELNIRNIIKGYMVEPIKNPINGTVFINITLRTIDMIEDIKIVGSIGGGYGDG